MCDVLLSCLTNEAHILDANHARAFVSKLRFSYEFAKLSLQFDATPSDKRAGIQTKIDDLRKKYSNIIALCTVAYSYRA